MNHIPPRAFRGIHIQVLDGAVSRTARMNPEDAMVPCGIGISARTCAGSSANAHCSYKDLSASLFPILNISAIYILPFPATGGLVFLTVTSVPAGKGFTRKRKQ